jgi:ABC-type Mn2+/Zn2+ transport system permease subunit
VNYLREILPMLYPGLVAGVAIALMCAVLSPLVVLKRMAFVGQGISHAAFGGIGIAAVLASFGGMTGFAGSNGGQFVIVLLFCLAAAFAIALLTQRRGTEADTAIGIVLVGSMTLGAILLSIVQARGRGTTTSWESILFGSILEVQWPEAYTAWGVAAAVLIVAWWMRRSMLFWAFDEPAAPAFGVQAGTMKLLLVLLVTLAIVTAMRLVGVVLATALLVLPGAAALRLSDRLSRVIVLSVVAAVLGVVLGVACSVAAEVVAPGACIVSVLVVLFLGARLTELLRSKMSGGMDQGQPAANR